MKTVEESAGICGYDANIHVKGQKRNLLVDTLRIPLSIYVAPADTHDMTGARCLLGFPHVLRAPPEEDLGRCDQAAGRS